MQLQNNYGFLVSLVEIFIKSYGFFMMEDAPTSRTQIVPKDGHKRLV